MTLFEYDRSLGVELLCGVDEAGRGPLAGDVYAAAVILPTDCEIDGLNDSKKLTEKKREELFDVITEKALSYSVATASVDEIEKHNILQATFLAMNRAVSSLDIAPSLVLVDGNKNPIENYNSRFLIKGDATSASIAAASILAKVSRDRYMKQLDEKYPEYMFSKHKGYGTKLHYEMLDKYGPSPVHRMSFLRKYFEQKGTPAARKTGDAGEQITCKYLENRGYEIKARNYGCSSGEIDVIAVKDDIIAFVEVKTRSKNMIDTPASAVDIKKQERIITTAHEYITSERISLQPRFDVAEVVLQGSGGRINYIKNAFMAEGEYVFF